MPKKYYILAAYPLGQKIHITDSYWNFIVEEKHPSIRGKRGLVLKTITNPDTIRASQKDKTVQLFYKRFQEVYLCVVVKVLNSEGFIITIYFTDKIKRGEILWQK